MAGTFGYELDPGKLTEEERAEIKEQVGQYKKYAELIQKGSYYRLSNPFQDTHAAWLNVVMLEVHGNMEAVYVKLRGLKPDSLYEEVVSGKCYYGSALMEAGIPVPAGMGEYPACQMEFREREE